MEYGFIFILFLVISEIDSNGSQGTASHEAAPSYLDQRTCNGLWPRQTNSSYIRP